MMWTTEHWKLKKKSYNHVSVYIVLYISLLRIYIRTLHKKTLRTYSVPFTSLSIVIMPTARSLRWKNKPKHCSGWKNKLKKTDYKTCEMPTNCWGCATLFPVLQHLHHLHILLFVGPAWALWFCSTLHSPWGRWQEVKLMASDSLACHSITNICTEETKELAGC